MASSSVHFGNTSTRTVATSKKSDLIDQSETEQTVSYTRKTDLLEEFPSCLSEAPKSQLFSFPVTSLRVKPDRFEEFKPLPCTVLDYNISETDIKGQRTQPLGVTQLHIKQTTAHYDLPPPGYVFPEQAVPPSPPHQVVQYSTGGGPVYIFLDDIWRKKVEEEQILKKENFKRLVEDTKKFDKFIKARDHRKLMKLVGPSWYQELSPQQLRTIDNLKKCIVKDVKAKTICHTQINMAELGLVLRPNHNHIKMALKKCCECPVEFLLILYQLMNRNRTKYSLNDRLLLSGVVHLTMRETLKELHIRIPSPPPPRPKPKSPPKKEKLKQYKSPYLVPFTFKPEKRKHTGVYKNNHIQYPESPYFSYINELKAEASEGMIFEDEEKETKEEGEGEEKEEKDKKPKKEKGPKILKTKKQSGITNAQEAELITELKGAQRHYNKLAGHDSVPFLRKPTIYIPCDHGITKIEEEEEETARAVTRSSDTETNATVSVEVKVTTDFNTYCQPIRKVCECKITFDEQTVSKNRGKEGFSEDTEDSDEEIENLPAIEQQDAEYTKEKQTDKDLLMQELGKTEDCPCKPAQKSIAVSTSDKKQSNRETQSERKITEKPQPQTEKQEQQDLQAKDQVEQLVTVVKRDDIDPCECEEKVHEIIETRLCQCERCKSDRSAAREKNKQVILKYKKDLEEELEEASGAYDAEIAADGGNCSCLQKFQSRVKMYKEMKKRFDAQHDLKATQQQYSIGGVTYTPTGEPVYMLGGAVPPKECVCQKAYQELLKEEKRLANMPKIPLGRQKYVIQGVRETDEGNVFIVTNAAAIEDCTCMKMYKGFEKKHMSCLQAYKEYLKKIELDKEEYMKELAVDGRFSDIKLESLDKNQSPEEISNNEKQSKAEPAKILSSNPVQAESILKAKSSSSRTPNQCTSSVKEASPECDNLAIDTDLNLTLEINKGKSNKSEKNVCIADPNYNVSLCHAFEPIVCRCTESSSRSTVTESSTTTEECVFRRFIILEKIPCKLSEQLAILKKALAVLAEDGFPLAKLPYCHKLPHFKLWMQLRCGKYWTQEDRYPYLMQSYGHWRHTGKCWRRIKIPKLQVTAEDALKYTWGNSKAVKKMASEIDTWYYRHLRQCNIGDGREYLASTYSYEFPTPNFRNCYFAYFATKEEDCICWKPWYLHEVKQLGSKKC